jgi:Grx4 family monothiol glutaredoxin
MLFMKGTPLQPRCGFSRQVVDLFSQHNVTYGSFNILADEAVRAALKEYSNWPTYPQVYVDGELVGGLDILKELIESGEFFKMVPPEDDIQTKLKKLYGITFSSTTPFIYISMFGSIVFRKRPSCCS